MAHMAVFGHNLSLVSMYGALVITTYLSKW